MKTTEAPKRYGRRALMKEERNAALPAVPAASTNGSTGRQHVAAARTLPTADSAAASAPFEEGLPVGLTASVFMDARSFSLKEMAPAGKRIHILTATMRNAVHSAIPVETQCRLPSKRMAKRKDC